jgi:membrane-bound ClpP family serine protease
MKTTIKDWLKVLVLLLDEAAAVALVLLVLWVLDVEIPLSITIVTALILGAIVFVIHRAIIPTFHKKKTTGSEGMIGLRGEVIQPLVPTGVIKVGDEYWKAKSVDDEIEAGREVEIMSIDGLTLKVTLKEE